MRITLIFVVSLFVLQCSPQLQTLDEEEVDGPQDEVAELSPERELLLSRFREPQLDREQIRHVMARYGHLDPGGVIPRKILEQAVVYYDTNLAHIENRETLSVIDFSKHSSQARFFVVDMNSGSVWPLHTAHGLGSDRDNDGFAREFSNVPNSKASSLGYYLTAETYSGRHGLSLRLDGLSPSNSNARVRAVVIHGATYVRNQPVRQGRSHGCPAVQMSVRTLLIDRIKMGSLIFAALSDN